MNDKGKFKKIMLALMVMLAIGGVSAGLVAFYWQGSMQGEALPSFVSGTSISQNCFEPFFDGDSNKFCGSFELTNQANTDRIPHFTVTTSEAEFVECDVNNNGGVPILAGETKIMNTLCSIANHWEGQFDVNITVD